MARRRASYRARRAAWTEEQRQTCVQRRRHRVAAESTEQRAAGLQQVRNTQRERLAAESAEQRAARLQQTSVKDGLPS